MRGTSRVAPAPKTSRHLPLGAEGHDIRRLSLSPVTHLESGNGSSPHDLYAGWPQESDRASDPSPSVQGGGGAAVAAVQSSHVTHGKPSAPPSARRSSARASCPHSRPASPLRSSHNGPRTPALIRSTLPSNERAQVLETNTQHIRYNVSSSVINISYF